MWGDNMNKKTKRYFVKLHNELRKDRPTPFYAILLLIVFCVVLSGYVFHQIGHNEGYALKERELRKEQKFQNQKELMAMELQEVWHIFLKYLMVKTIYWLPIIIVVLGVGWIIHGIF